MSYTVEWGGAVWDVEIGADGSTSLFSRSPAMLFAHGTYVVGAVTYGQAPVRHPSAHRWGGRRLRRVRRSRIAMNVSVRWDRWQRERAAKTTNARLEEIR